MIVYRIAKAHFIDDLSGRGARIYGGRWNHQGTSMIYASESAALATVEYLVHVHSSVAPTDLCLASIQVPDEIIPEEIHMTDLPENWRVYPAPSRLAELGDEVGGQRRVTLASSPLRGC